MLRLENATVKYQKKTVISSLTHVFTEGKVTAIVGESGIGKTTLVNLLAGLIRPDFGKVVCDKERIAYVFQEPRLFEWMTAIENLRVVSDNEKAENALSLMGLSESADKYPSELSGGMKQRVSIARALAYDADIIFLDEPFKGLDPEMRREISDKLFSLSKGKTVIMITHDEQDLRYADEVLRLGSNAEGASVLVKSNTAETE
ncbi:MAG: ABC transporter ATP-binding protein [Ruminococcaceae bacterium]|nr:ABC transporter ATP-binding protein [Oscillospiraceae bacterium]